MAVPTTRSEFKEYCLRQLEKPVIEMNILPMQKTIRFTKP